ncbi:unnamed protein product [Cuscuta campestris]|uniref:Uncharacterized protein n=1 Tax=Cuscuta campestris TaxID=132261 RepID=A0A484LYD9_9ASTE|nr:unnamed protein product [Cuscuta campestris]
MYLACTFDDLPLELLALYEALQALVLKQLRESYYHKDTIMSYSTSNTRSLLSRTWIVIFFDVKRGENGLSSLTRSLEEEKTVKGGQTRPTAMPLATGNKQKKKKKALKGDESVVDGYGDAAMPKPGGQSTSSARTKRGDDVVLSSTKAMGQA